MSFIVTASLILGIILFHDFLGKLGVLRAFFQPKVHAIALREMTAIQKRADLEAVFGPHDGHYSFTVTKGKILAARPWWRWIIGNIALEALMIFGLLSVVFGKIAPNIPLIVIAGVYSAVAHIVIIKSFRGVREEVEEEIAFKEQIRRKHLDKLAQERREREARGS